MAFSFYLLQFYSKFNVFLHNHNINNLKFFFSKYAKPFIRNKKVPYTSNHWETMAIRNLVKKVISSHSTREVESWTLVSVIINIYKCLTSVRHFKPIEHLKHLQHLHILKCASVKHVEPVQNENYYFFGSIIRS